MKNKDFTIASIIVLSVIFGILLYIKLPKNVQDNYAIYLGDYSDALSEDGYLYFTNYNDYYKELKDNNLTEQDFKNNNYLAISVELDGCSEQGLKLTNYNVINNEITVNFTYKKTCEHCISYYDYYLLKVDKDLINPKVNIKYEALNDEECNNEIDIVAKKPLIYLYPENTMMVTIKLGKPNNLTTTYPSYNNGWIVTAYPDGTLIDQKGREYYGLYWEGKNDIDTNYNDGFVVNKKDLIPFLEEKLSILGLNDKEANEFIIYWLPILEKSNYNLIRFENISVINQIMPLDINPEPDTIIRVLMEYKPLDKRINIKKQELTTPTRYGFTVVEWGGMELK